MARIFDQLQNAALEPITTGTLPPAAQHTYRVFFNTTTNKVVVSDGTNWITSGEDYVIHTFKLNGRIDYTTTLSDLDRFDGPFPVPFNCTLYNIILSAGIRVEATGFSGENVVVAPDVRYGTDPYAAGATVFSNTPSLRKSVPSFSSSTSIRAVDVVGGYPAVDGSVVPILSTTSLTTGNYLWMEIGSYTDSDSSSSTSYVEDIQCTIILRRS